MGTNVLEAIVSQDFFPTTKAVEITHVDPNRFTDIVGRFKQDVFVTIGQLFKIRFDFFVHGGSPIVVD